MRSAQLTVDPNDHPDEPTTADRPTTVEDPEVDGTAAPADRLAVGTRVDVRNRLDARWAKGFEVVGFEVVAPPDDGYRLRRISDGFMLPTTFKVDDVRPERRKANNWWY